MEERFDRLEQMIGSLVTRFDAVDQRFDAVDQRFDAVDQRFDAVDQRLDEVNHRISVLHEDVKADFRFSLEALTGTAQQINARITEESEGIKALIQPIADAVRHLSR